MALQLSFTGEADELMLLSMDIAEEFELDHDGWDFGEVMGIWIQYMNSVAEDIEFIHRNPITGSVLSLALVENGLFQWEGLPD